MKRIKRSNEEILQYVYDYGIQEASRMLSMSKEQIENQINEEKGVYYPQKYTYKKEIIDQNVLNYFAQNYQKIYNKFVSENKILKCSTSLEDVLHESIVNTATKEHYNDNLELFIYSEIYLNIRYWKFRKLTYNKYLTYADFIKDKEEVEKYDF